MHDQVTDEENDQHPWPDVDNVPVDPPDPPEPPDRTMKWRDEPPSAELEGDWEVPVSCNTGLTAGETEASGPSIGDEDPRNWPKGMQDVSECECEPLKEEVESTHLREVQMTKVIQVTKCTCQECQDVRK